MKKATPSLVWPLFFLMLPLLRTPAAAGADEPALDGGAAPATVEPSGVTPPDDSGSEETEAQGVESWLRDELQGALARGGILLGLAIAWLAGLLTSLMGCVYPLIPVAMAVIGTRETSRRSGAFFLSLTYVAGMSVLYTTLGLSVAAMGGQFGAWLGSPWVTGFIVLFFGAMGLSMIGVFEFRLPAAWMDRLNRVGGRGYAGAFLAGLVSGLVAAPCTGPVLSFILVLIAASQDLVLGFFLMLAFSLGFGLLFLLVGTFAGLVARLPKSGSWMEGVKSSFGMIMMGMALYFLRPVAPWLQSSVDGLPWPLAWAGAALALGILAGGFHIDFHEATAWRKARKLLGASLGGLAVFLLAAGLSVAQSRIDWKKDLPAALQTARAQGRPVMIDFWATWCPACIQLDQKTFSDEQVAAELERFVSVKLDCTRSAEDEALQALMDRYDANDLPTIRFVNSAGRLLEKPIVKGFLSPDELLRLLRQVR